MMLDASFLAVTEEQRVGEWQFELECEVEGQNEFTEILRKVRNKFPSLISDYSILQVTKEHKRNYLPITSTED